MTIGVPFSFVDVFADDPLTGNPLALIPDADGISVDVMRAISREFNQSETTFIVEASLPGVTYRLRSFTPGGFEVLGAGHNALGAWIWLAEKGHLPGGQENFVQQIGSEALQVHVHRKAGERSVVAMDQSPPVFGRVADDQQTLAKTLGIDVADFATGDPFQVVSTGAGHLLVPVRDRTVVDRVVPDAAGLLGILRTVGGEGCYVYSRDPVDPAGGAVAYARFFNPTVGIVEDPATGTAAGPLVAALVAAGSVDEGTPAIVEQGYALGRPSRLRVSVFGQRVRLSGSGLVVADGTLHI